MSAIASKLGQHLASIALVYARNWSMKEARVRGEFRGKFGLEVDAEPKTAVKAGYRAGTPCKFIVNDPIDPSYFRHESGYDYMLETPLVTDGGSTPRLARKLCKKWADLEPFGKFRIPFFNHDANYTHAGCWVRLPREEANKYEIDVPLGADRSDWIWMPLSRVMADTLLFQMMPSCGGRNGEVNAIFRAVRVGGGRAWRRHRARESDIR